MFVLSTGASSINIYDFLKMFYTKWFVTFHLFSTTHPHLLSSPNGGVQRIIKKITNKDNCNTRRKLVAEATRSSSDLIFKESFLSQVQDARDS